MDARYRGFQAWAERLKLVFDIDISVCPLRGGMPFARTPNFHTTLLASITNPIATDPGTPPLYTTGTPAG